MKSLRFYRKRNGQEPFREWLESINDSKTLAHVNNRVRRLAINHRGDFKRVGSGVYELRIHYGPGIRIYFATHRANVIILLMGGCKNSQKHDIQKAKRFWKDYKEQYHERSE